MQFPSKWYPNTLLSEEQNSDLYTPYPLTLKPYYVHVHMYVIVQRNNLECIYLHGGILWAENLSS